MRVQNAWTSALLSDIADIGWGDLSVTKKSYVEEGFTAFSATGADGLLPHYDYDEDGIVVSAIGANCGKIWRTSGKWSCIKNTMRILVKESPVTLDYLFYYLSDPNIFPKRGSGQPFISQGDARNIVISYPPLEEQSEIVSLLDENFSRLDAAETDIENILLKSKQFRKAFIDEQLNRVVGIEVELGSVCKFVTGYAYKTSYWQESGIPVVKIMNVKNREVNLNGCSYISSDIAEITKVHKVNRGDLLFNMTGATLGGFGFYNLEEDARLNQRVGKFLPLKPDTLDLNYLAYFLEAASTQRKIAELAKGAAQANISPKDIDTLLIKLPSFSEQLRLVAALEAALSRLDKLLLESRAAASTSKILRNSLLRDVFKREIVKEARNV